MIGEQIRGSTFQPTLTCLRQDVPARWATSSFFLFSFFIPCSARFKSEWPLGVSGPSMRCGHSCSEDRIRRGRIWVRHYAVHLLFWFFPTNDRNPGLPSPCLKSSSVSPEQTGGVNAAAGTKACLLIIVPGKTNTPSHVSEINLVMWQILKGNYHNNSSETLIYLQKSSKIHWLHLFHLEWRKNGVQVLVSFSFPFLCLFDFICRLGISLCSSFPGS